MKNKKLPLRCVYPIIIGSYALFTFSVLLLFPFTDLYTLVGFHLPMYAFFFLLNGGTLESNIIIATSAIVCIASLFIFIMAIILGLWKQKYVLFISAVLFDAIATISYVVFNILHAGLMDIHIWMLIGGLLDAVLGTCLFLHRKATGRDSFLPVRRANTD